MNAETGRIYYGVEAIEAAKERGEKIIELSPGVARQLTASEELVARLGIPVQKFAPAELRLPGERR
jgi:hypothetical protein